MDIRMIFFDLDGTFLDDGKKIPPENIAALQAAADRGVIPVPASGRIHDGMPQELRELPFLRWYIASNGAYVYDSLEERILSRAEIPPARAIAFYEYADSLGLPYDCYQDCWGYMTEDMLHTVMALVPDPGVRKLILDLRSPVPELKRYLLEKGHGVQKMQLYLEDPVLRLRLLEELPDRFPDLHFSSAMPFNIEVNVPEATKGHAMRRLCRELGVAEESVMALGDETNDLDMIRSAGLGVAMGNAVEAVKQEADYITGSNNEGGFAAAVERFVLQARPT